MQARMVLLVPRDEYVGADPTPRSILLWDDNAGAWYGRAVDVPHSPALAWPKTAWRAVEDKEASGKL